MTASLHIGSVVPAATRNLISLDILRGVAASLVALYHAGHLVSETRYFGVTPWHGVFLHLYTGVDCFFVLSGFLIAWVHWGDIGRCERVGRYAERRFTRVYPVYWIVLTLVIALHMAHPGVTNPAPVNAFSLITSYVLFPNSGTTLLGVAWTLYYEVAYYVIFGCVIAIGMAGVIVFGVWAVLILSANVMGLAATFPLSFILDPFNLEFIAGIAVALILRQRRIPMPSILASVAGGLFLGLAASDPTHLVGDSRLGLRLIFGSLAALTILGLVELERTKSVKTPGWLRLVGLASYSVYLVHTVVQPPLMQYGVSFLRPLGVQVSVIVLAALSIAFGVAFHLAIEKPVLRMTRSWFLQRRSGGATFESTKLS